MSGIHTDSADVMKYQVVEYGSDLSGWNPLPIPETTADPVTITPGGSADHVKVTIPNPGTQGFVRLKVSQ
ncbi:MAG: hypothetical protein NTW21_24425 [Verrucomicrobia bacterium]|nr:hypothetical protein [Verrucomicrobiota bacterium]